MYICICHGITRREVEEVLAGGASTVGDVKRSCGAGGDCGSCVRRIDRMIEKRNAEQNPLGCGELPVASIRASRAA